MTYGSATGNLGKDPVLKKTNTGKSVITVDIGCYGGRKENDGYKTEWITVRAWEKNADRLGQCRKGDRVHVEGSLKTDIYTTQNGNKKTVTYIDANTVERIEKAQQQPQQQYQPPVQETRQYPTENLWTAQNQQNDQQDDWTAGLELNDDSLPF